VKTIICHCDTAIQLDVPDELDLDTDAASFSAMADGSFLSTVCKNCGATLRPELALRVKMASKGLDAFVVPELERLGVYRGKTDAPRGVEILVGYAELFERVRILRDGLNPMALEVVRYVLLGKAEESMPDGEPSVRYHGLEGGKLGFHVLGSADGNTGVVALPRPAYDQVLADLSSTAKKAPFSEVFKGQYRSIKKLAFSEDGD